MILYRACGATIVNRTDEIKEEDIGTGAGLFEIRKVGDEYVAGGTVGCGLKSLVLSNAVSTWTLLSCFMWLVYLWSLLFVLHVSIAPLSPCSLLLHLPFARTLLHSTSLCRLNRSPLALCGALYSSIPVVLILCPHLSPNTIGIHSNAALLRFVVLSIADSYLVSSPYTQYHSIDSHSPILPCL